MEGKYKPRKAASGKTPLKEWWKGVVESNFDDLYGAINGHIAGIQDRHRADDVDCNGRPLQSKIEDMDEHIAEVSSTSPYVKDGEVYVDIDNKVYGLAGKQYHTYGVSIDLNNSNPRTSVTYINDAVGMVANSPDWYKQPIYKDLKPCLLKDGEVVGYLNPDNLAEFVDGTEADISSPDAGDVMLEIPKLGYRIAKSNGTLTVQVTDDPHKDGFAYKAHTRTVEGDREKLYLGICLSSKASVMTVKDTATLWESNFEEGISSEHATNNDGTTNNNAVKPVGWDYAMTANDLSAIAYYENTNTTELKLTCGPWSSAHLVKNVNDAYAGADSYELSFKIRFANDGHADQFWVCLNNDPETKAEWPQDNTRVIGVRQEEYSCIVSANTDFGAVTKSVSLSSLYNGIKIKLVWDKAAQQIAYYVNGELICEKPFAATISGFRFFSSTAEDYPKTFYLDDVKWEAHITPVEVKTDVLSSSAFLPVYRDEMTKCRKMARAKGKGYDVAGFYPWTLYQALTLIKMKNLHSRSVGGPGYDTTVSGDEFNVGSTFDEGMDYVPSGGPKHVKCLGLEDPWGGGNSWIDGLATDEEGYLVSATDNFNSDRSTRICKVAGGGTFIGGYIKEPIGTNSGGFLLGEKGGSRTTYWCDQGHYYEGSYAHIAASTYSGLFGVNVSGNAGQYTARLMYL